jgi:hypothetical protein
MLSGDSWRGLTFKPFFFHIRKQALEVQSRFEVGEKI